jgi:hypothetical protein
VNIEEVLKQMTGVQHRLAVYSAIIEHLEGFLPSDIGDSEKEIVVEGCLEPKVSISSLESVLARIHELYKKEKDELTKIGSMEAKSNEKPKPTKRKPRATKPKKS